MTDSGDFIRCAVFFGLILGLHLWCSLQGWTNVPVDGHEFRQTQTAITIRYLAQDGLRLDYPTPLLGKPWSIPLEFPLYQGTCAVVVRATGLSVEQAARLVGLFFFYLTLPALFLLAGRLTLPPARRLLLLSCVLAAPLYLFYQRAVLIESTGLCFAVWFLYFFWRGLAGRPAWVATALAIGAVAALVKAPTLCVFLTPAFFLMVAELRRAGGLDRWFLLGRAALMAGGSLAVGFAWTAHADGIKQLNPLSAVLMSSAQAAWSTGEFPLRFQPAYWLTIGTTTKDTVLGGVGLAAIALLALPFAGAARRTIGLLLLCYLAPLLVFSNVYRIHDYYFFANGVFLLAALALTLNRLLDLGPQWRGAGWTLLLLVVGSGFVTYFRGYHLLIPNNESRVPELSRALQAVTRPDDVLAILGQDWNPVLPYTSGRRAMMVPFPLENNRAAQVRALALLEHDTVGALVVTGNRRHRMDMIQPIIRQFGLSATPVLISEQTDVYLPATRLDEIVPILASLELHQHFVDTRGKRIAVANMPEATRYFTMMTPAPREVAAQFGIGLNALGDTNVLGAHPANELVFPVPPGAGSVRAGFGLLPAAYADSAKHTDGVMFEILLHTREGQTRLLAEKLLTPATNPGDRGTQEFDVSLPPGVAGDIILRTGAGPANDLAFDWAYWSFVTIR